MIRKFQHDEGNDKEQALGSHEKDGSGKHYAIINLKHLFSRVVGVLEYLALSTKFLEDLVIISHHQSSSHK